MAVKRHMMMLLGVLAMTGCNGGSDRNAATFQADEASLNEQVDARCDEISGGDTAVAHTPGVTCVGCTSSDENQAIDGDQASHSSIEFAPGSDGPWMVRVDAQPGLVFPAGSKPGVVLGAPQNLSNLEVIVTTYLDGVAQDSECEQSVHISAGGRVVVGTTTTQAFDAVAFSIERNHLSVADSDCGVHVLNSSNAYEIVEARQVHVHEFCHDFRFP